MASIRITHADLLAQREPREVRIARFTRAAVSLRAGRPIDAITADELGSAILACLTAGGSLTQRLRLERQGSHANVKLIANNALDDSSLYDDAAHASRENGVL